MKYLKKFILPVAIILIGTGAAFATNSAKNADGLLVSSYRYDPSATGVKCILTPMQCSTVQGAICTWKDSNNKDHDLFEFDNVTACGDELYKP